MDRHPTIIFDGVCNLCNATVDFVLRRDHAGRLRFAALQSEAGRMLMLTCHAEQPQGDAVVLLQDGQCYSRSDAILRIVQWLPGAWPLLAGLRILPRRLRDVAYNLIARNRYRWFGQRSTCRMTVPGYEKRFLTFPDAEVESRA